MHEWLEALRKSAKASQPGVPADEVRRAETECGVPFPAELAELYQALNGGSFLGEVTLFPLHAAEGQPSVLEKSRLKLVGLPAAGVWRFGLKGPHRHLFTARKSAMVEQGDGGGPLPGWVEQVGDESWVYGTWNFEDEEMRLYRALPDMLAVLVPPAEEEHEGFGERTYARALSAVEGALQELGMDEQVEDLLGDEGAEPVREPTIREVIEALVSASPPKRKAAARKAVRKAAAKKATPKAAAKKAPAKKAAGAGKGAKKAAAKKTPAKKAPAKKAARKAPARKAAGKGAAPKKAAAKKAPAKKGAARRGKR